MDRLDALKVFCAVVETGGFGKAAERLGISTSSVTNQVAALETHFNTRLLNRTTRSMSLTDEGRQCHERALHLLSDIGTRTLAFQHLDNGSEMPFDALESFDDVRVRCMGRHMFILPSRIGWIIASLAAGTP